MNNEWNQNMQDYPYEELIEIFDWLKNNKEKINFLCDSNLKLAANLIMSLINKSTNNIFNNHCHKL